MAIDFATFNSVVAHVIDAGFPVLIRGRHGIGKSEVVYQFAAERGLPVVERRASQMTEGDLMGLPSIDGESTRWNAPDWLKEACDNAVVLFLDEVDRATMEVRQGIFELTDSRKLNGWHLHPQTRIFAAVNGGEHSGASSYQVGEMDPAELDRWTVFDVEPTVSDWLSWAKDKVDPVVWDFINQNHNHLEHNGDYEPNKVYPSRRSWDRLNQVLVGAGLLEEAGPELFSLSVSFVGFEAAVAFNDFVKNYERVITVDQLLAGEREDAIEALDLNGHCALIEKLEASERCKELNQEENQNLANYFVGLPSEAAMKLWGVISQQAGQNVVGFHGAQAASGKSVGEFLGEILSPQ